MNKLEIRCIENIKEVLLWDSDLKSNPALSIPGNAVKMIDSKIGKASSENDNEFVMDRFYLGFNMDDIRDGNVLMKTINTLFDENKVFSVFKIKIVYVNGSEDTYVFDDIVAKDWKKCTKISIDEFESCSDIDGIVHIDINSKWAKEDKEEDNNDFIGNLVEFISREHCCNDCFLKKVSELLEQNATCNEELRKRILRVLNDYKKSDKEKVIAIYSFVSEYM